MRDKLVCPSKMSQNAGHGLLQFVTINGPGPCTLIKCYGIMGKWQYQRRFKIAILNKKFKPKQTDSKQGLFVDVQEGQFEKAFRKFRNKVEDSGLLIEIRERMEYEKPCTARKKAKSQAKKRWLKKVASTQPPKKLY